jgi:hypothetical protein
MNWATTFYGSWGTLYHKFLVWETDNKTRRYRYFRRLESLFDPFFPKSLVVYVKKMPQQKTAS